MRGELSLILDLAARYPLVTMIIILLIIRHFANRKVYRDDTPRGTGSSPWSSWWRKLLAMDASVLPWVRDAADRQQRVGHIRADRIIRRHIERKGRQVPWSRFRRPPRR